MKSVNILQARSSLSRLIEAVNSGTEKEIVITRSGRPAAKLVPVSARPPSARIGVAKGLFDVPDDINAHNGHVSRLFGAAEA